LQDVLDALKTASVPAGKIYNIADIASDPHYKARGVIETIESADGLKVDMPGVMPKLSETPGKIRYRAPMLGEHTDETLKRHGFTDQQIIFLKQQGILA
jgi:formyl-CoA transferase